MNIKEVITPDGKKEWITLIVTVVLWAVWVYSRDEAVKTLAIAGTGGLIGLKAN